MPTRRGLQKLACLRLKEAEALYSAACYDGSAYLCGYVIELALKAAICATIGVDEYPSANFRGALKSHDFEDLKLLAGMERAFAGNPTLLANWSLAAEWRPDRRYEPEGTFDQTAGLAVLEAVRAYPDGVLACISRRW